MTRGRTPRLGAWAVLILVGMCIGGGLGLAGPGLWAQWYHVRALGSVLSIETEPVADAELVAVQVTFLVPVHDDRWQIAYGWCDPFGTPVADPQLPVAVAHELINSFWQNSLSQRPVFYARTHGPETARMVIIGQEDPALLFELGLALLVTPLLSWLVLLLLRPLWARRSRAVSG